MERTSSFSLGQHVTRYHGKRHTRRKLLFAAFPQENEKEARRLPFHGDFLRVIAPVVQNYMATIPRMAFTRIKPPQKRQTHATILRSFVVSIRLAMYTPRRMPRIWMTIISAPTL